jgi:tetraacyldisaccharide 4'-kinase
MIILRILLLPLAFLYGLIAQLRNLLYDFHMLKIYRCDKPVISIGNLTAGGTGKTPFTIWLARQFTGRGKKVAVISRGYGRRSKGFQLVSDGTAGNVNTMRHGDEPALMALLAPHVLVAVAEQRSKAIEELNQRYDIDLFILDDAFQHRAVFRDVDIVLQAERKLLKNKWLIPAGVLREFAFNIKRADIILDRETDGEQDNHYRCVFRSGDLFDIDFKQWGTIDSFKQRCVAFAGIAHPDNFSRDLQEHSVPLIAFIPFKDHYHFSATDIHFLLGQCAELDCKYLLCTQKDMVKIREIDGIKNLLQKAAVSVLAPALNMVLDDAPFFLKKIESRLDWFRKR